MPDRDDIVEITRRDLLAAGGAGAAGLVVLGAPGCGPLAGTEGESAATPDERPNLVLVVIDSLRTDHIGAYGGRRARTPSLDAFARESLRFTRARPESMPTVPARRAIMTGRRSFPFRGWRPEKGLTASPGFQSIPRNQVTLPQLLRRAGYLTAYVTDTPHILSAPYDRFRRSFDVRQEVVGQVPLRRHPRRKVGDRYLRRWWPRELWDEPGAGRLREYLTLNRGRRSEDDYLAARVFRTGMRFLDSARERQPFALIVDAFDPHEPWDPPYRYLRRYAHVRRGPQPIQPFATPSGRTSDLRSSTLRRARALYAGEVTFVDAWFGHLMERIDELGLSGSTWVVVLSDHGVLLGERGIIGKSFSNLHREIWDVPFMIRHPQGVAAGRRSRYMASTHDVTPTLLSAAGLGVPRRMEGEDLTAFFEGRRPKRRTYFTSAYNDWVVAGDERWLLICNNQGGEARLYDRRADPRERRDVASRHPRQVRRLYRKVLADAGGRRLPRFD